MCAHQLSRLLRSFAGYLFLPRSQLPWQLLPMRISFWRNLYAPPFSFTLFLSHFQYHFVAPFSPNAPPIQLFCITVTFIFFRSNLTVFLPSLLTCLTLFCFLLHYFCTFIWLSLFGFPFQLKPLPPPLLGLFFLLCYTISPTFMLSFIFMLNLPLYICACSLCLSFSSAPFVRPYEMNWHKWHFMGPCSTTSLNTAGNHKSHCLLRMPLLMCSIWFNASVRWGGNRRWGLGGEVERELELRMEIKGTNRRRRRWRAAKVGMRGWQKGERVVSRS